MARQAVLELIADASKLKSSLSDAEGHTDRFGASMGKLGGVIAGALTGAAVLKFGSDSVKAFTESEQAQSKLELALKNSHATVGVHASDFEKLNSELAKHTLVDDDVIADTEARMVTFGASKTQIEQMIPTVLDFAAKMGIDAPEAADLFDKASLGSTKALKTLGIEGYKPTGDQATDLANIQNLLKEKVAGAAQAQLDAAGPGATMKKSMDELQETVGKYLVPALQKLAEVAVAILDFFAAHPVATLLVAAIGSLAAAIWIVNTATAAWAVVTGAMTTAFWALNSAMVANPIGLIVAAIALLVGGLILAYTQSETFRDIVNGVFRGVLQVVGDVIGWILQSIAGFLGGLASMADAASKIPVIGDKFKGVGDSIRGVEDRLLGAADKMHNLGVQADNAAGDMIYLNGRLQALSNLPDVTLRVGAAVPGLAVGGPVRAGSPYVVGEDGPELFIPTTSGAIVPNGTSSGAAAGGAINYSIQVSAIDPAAASEAVITAIKEYERRNGTDWRVA